MQDMHKAAVRRFNAEVIEGGSAEAFAALMDPEFINHSVPPGAPQGASGMWYTFDQVLRPALSGLKVVIHDQLAEGDRVVTRKSITGRHTGALLGLAATGRAVEIQVIDIVRLRDGRYLEHWGVNTLAAVLAGLRA